MDDASILFPNGSAPLIRVSLMNKTIGASFSPTISNWLTKEESRDHQQDRPSANHLVVQFIALYFMDYDENVWSTIV